MKPPARAVRSDVPFRAALATLAGAYALLIVGMLAADFAFTSPAEILAALRSPAIRHAAKVSFATSTLSAILSVWFAVPIGYLLSRASFRGKALLDSILDVPIVLPPMVVGLSLLILFQTAAGRALEAVVPVTYHLPAVVLAQFAVACAFAIRTLRVTFDQIDTRYERVALTLGCNRAQAFTRVVLPLASRGTLAAGLLAWSRALGEFGPVLVFAGATRMRTEVLPTSIYLELSIGNVEAAVAVSLLFVTIAVLVLVLARALGARGLTPIPAEGRDA